MGRGGLSAGSTRHVYGRWHGRFAVSLGLCALTAMLLALAANPERARAATGQITGHITDGSSNDLQGVFVSARNVNGSIIRTDTTNSSGSYTITGLSTGTYIVHFDAGGVVGDFASMYYNDKAFFGSANHVAVTDGQTTPNIDASLPAGATINGHVTDDSNAAIEGVCVSAIAPDGEPEYDVRTDVGGNYSITNVGAGSWKLYFDADPSGCVSGGNFASEYYDDKPDLDSADPVTVTAGATTSNINASLASLHGLSVQLAGLGSGTVTSSPAAINCGSTCSASFTSSTSVTLTAAPGAGSTFAGWSGDCSGTGTCQVTMSQARSVTATFANSPPVQRTLTVARSGTGSGTATSNPAGINCGSTCSAQFNGGTQVILTASAASGSTFTGWSGGGCSGTGTCRVTMSADQAVTATFSANPPRPSSPPNTKISTAKIDQQSNSATFMFTQVGGGKAKATSGFQCALLEKKQAKPKFMKCTSPKKYKHLKPRRYTFEVRAFGSAGKDPTPAKREFRIKP